MKKIPLTNGGFALVDNEDYEKISLYGWYGHSRGNTVYAERKEGGKTRGQKTIMMHHAVMGSNRRVDHKDGNGLNNQRQNLRHCTVQQNISNRGKFSKASSKYKGVSWDEGKRKWKVRVRGKHVGCFVAEREAAKAYDTKAIEVFGEFARTNFKQKG